MLRFLARFLAMWLLAGALVALVVDGARTISSGELVLTPIAELWEQVGPGSLEAARSAVETSVGAWLWDPVLVWVLQAPAFIFLVVLGSLLLWVGQKPRPVLPELELR